MSWGILTPERDLVLFGAFDDHDLVSVEGGRRYDDVYKWICGEKESLFATYCEVRCT